VPIQWQKKGETVTKTTWISYLIMLFITTFYPLAQAQQWKLQNESSKRERYKSKITRKELSKNMNHENSWLQIFNGKVDFYAHDIKISPSDPSIIYAAGNGVYRSTNSGVSWDSIGGNFSLERINSNNKICHIQLPQAADIILNEEAVAPGGKLSVSLIPKANLSNLTVSFSEQGGTSSKPQKLEVKEVKLNNNFNVKLNLPVNLKSNGKIRPQGKAARVESKTFFLEVRGTLPDGNPAYSANIIIFDSLENGLYLPLKLVDYLKKYGNDAGLLEPDTVVNEEGNVQRVPSNTKLEKDNSVQSNVTVHVSGKIKFQDTDGGLNNLGYVRIEVYEDDNGTGTFLGTCYTNSTGDYSITVTDNEPDNALELYLKVKTINDDVSVESKTHMF
jgi:hypothetical protein